MLADRVANPICHAPITFLMIKRKWLGNGGTSFANASIPGFACGTGKISPAGELLNYAKISAQVFREAEINPSHTMNIQLYSI